MSMGQPTIGTPSNTAAWLVAKHAPLEVKSAPYAHPTEHEIVVKNCAVAVNPIDWVLQTAPNFVFSWIKSPFILGSDVAGEVVEIGSGVSRFKVGDRVLGHAVGTDPSRNRAAEGSFQLYTVLLADMAAPLPHDMSYERACVLPLGLSTAACGLFEKDQLALVHPSERPRPTGKTLLVWGGSTSVGSNAIQLAVCAGYDVVTTASPKNFGYVKQLGASAAFDYNDSRVVQNLIAALRGKTLAGALAVGAGSGDACLDVVHGCTGNKFVSMATFPISMDTTSTRPASLVATLSMVRSFMWGNLTMALKSRTRGIRTKYIFGSSLIKNEVGSMIYADFLPRALADGRFIAAPPPRVVGSGLESLQAGMDLQRKGISASKVVVALPSS